MSLREDPSFLRSDQYRDSRNLSDRLSLHDRFSTNPQGWFPWLAARLGLHPGDRVLEVGGGPGWLWIKGANVLPPVELVHSDLSIGMVREACSNLRGSGRPTRSAVADARDLPFADASFDCVIANHMLYHVSDRPCALAEIARVLVPEGRLYASTIGGRHLAEIDVLARELHPDVREHIDFETAFTLENGAEQLAEVFERVRVERYEDELRVTEFAPLFAYLRSMIAANEIDPERLSRVRARVELEIERRGSFEVTKATGLFSARRRA